MEPVSASPEPTSNSLDLIVRQRFDAFERAWGESKSGESPQLDGFLIPPPSVPASDLAELRRLTLLELIPIDFEYRWRRAFPVRTVASKPAAAPKVEEYLTRFPELKPDIDSVLALIGAEQRARSICKQEWSLEDYVSRFPHLENRLRGVDERFVIERLLGKGGFGCVYLAEDTKLRRMVAIKVLLPKRGKKARNNVLKEGQNAGRLDHANIVPVFDALEPDKHHVNLIYQYVDGGTLTDLIRDDPPSYVRSAEIIRDLANALDHAHQRDVHHFDIKPDNVLMSKDGRPRLTDFGLALLTQDPRTQEIRGTAAYMSPEQASGDSVVDHRSDIFSLGIVFYELLCGRLPWGSRSQRELLREVRRGVISPPSKHADIPEGLEQICLKATARSVQERYKSARQFAGDLEEWIKAQQGVESARPPKHPRAVAEKANDSTAKLNSDTDATLPAIQFRRLGSYVAADAGFYLRLLPGGKNRDPEPLCDWLAWLNEEGIAKSFPIGLLGGDTGSGKSSFLQAGLIPRVGPKVTAIYIEATAHGTAEELLRQLRKKKLAKLDATLPEALAELAEGSRLPAGGKLLVVLDQFEQHLHIHPRMEDDELIDALRYCDGDHMQCLIAVRDGFHGRLNELFDYLDFPLDNRRSFRTLSPFSSQHVAFLLHEFGAAIGRLPSDEGELTAPQREFLRLAAERLCEGQPPSPIKIALFIEMMRPRPEWTPAILAQAASLDELGIIYLEEMCSSTQPNPRYRVHSDAVPRLLMALLPEYGEDDPPTAPVSEAHLALKRPRTAKFLQSACGYEGRDRDFSDLIDILSRELPLITPVESSADGLSDADPKSDPEPEYRLTHDFLVPAVRGWIERLFGQTEAGRAELSLRRYTSLWLAHDRRSESLPGVWETLQIWWFVPGWKRTAIQGEFANASIQYHSFRSGLLTLFILLVSLAFGIGGPLLAFHFQQLTRSKQEQLGRLALERGIREIRDSNFEDGLAYLAQAWRELPEDSPIRQSVINHASNAIDLPALSLIGTDIRDVHNLSLTPDGEKAVMSTGYGGVVCSLRTGESLAWFDATFGPLIAVSPDGQRVVTGFADIDLLSAFDLNTFERIPLYGYESTPSSDESTCIAFSSNGEHVLVGRSTGLADLYNSQSGKLIPTEPWRHSNYIRGVGFAPDGKIAITAGGFECRLWNVSSGKPLSFKINHQPFIATIAIAPDGKSILTAGNDGWIRRWETTSGKELNGVKMSIGPFGPKLAISPDGRRYCCGRSVGIVTQWDLDSDENLKPDSQIGSGIDCKTSIQSVQYRLAGQQFVSATDSAVRLWNSETGIQNQIDGSYKIEVDALAIDQSGRTIASARLSDRALLWDVDSHKEISGEWNNRRGVKSTSMSSDGRFMIVCDASVASLWDVDKGIQIGKDWHVRVLRDDITFSTNSHYVLIRNLMEYTLWGTETGTQIGKEWLQLPGTATIFSPDDRRLAILIGDSMGLIDTQTAERIELPEAGFGQSKRPIRCARFTPDGARIASAFERAIRVRDAKTGVVVGDDWNVGAEITDMAFSSDGKYVFVGCRDSTVRMLDAESGVPVGDKWRHSEEVESVVISPDNQRVVICGHNNAISIWDVESGTQIGMTLKVKPYQVAARARFSPDGDRLYAWTRLSGLYSWQMRRPWHSLMPEAIGGRIVEKGGVRNLTGDERREHWKQLVNDARWTKENENYEKRARISFHRRNATESEAKSNWFAAEFHLSRLLKEYPSDSDLKKRLDGAKAELANEKAAEPKE